MNEKRPELVTEERLHYLDVLRDTGDTNMYGAGRYLEAEFDLSRTDARTVLVYWMETFSERHA